MKKIFGLEMLAVALVFGMTVIGCVHEECEFNGIWVNGNGDELRLRNGRWEELSHAPRPRNPNDVVGSGPFAPRLRGTYTVGDGSIYMVTTHRVNAWDGRWISRNAARRELSGLLPAMANIWLEENFPTQTTVHSLNDDTITLRIANRAVVLTRR